MSAFARPRHGVPFLILSFVVALSARQSGPPRPAAPVSATTGILDALRSHQLVALGDAHGNEQVHAVRLALIRDPRFAAVVNDIVVEFGSARYQERLDRFMRGDNVPDDQLREVWQNTTAWDIGWDRPIYEDFFRAVRAANASLPVDRKLRVLLGDPAIDWDAVHGRDDLMKWLDMRDRHAAEVIQREVLAKGRRALIVYGSGHLPRIDPSALVGLLEHNTTTRVFTIWTNTDTDLKPFQAGVDAWSAPSLSVIAGTALGAAPFISFFPVRPDRVTDQLRALRMEDEFEAILYLGPPSSMTTAPLPPARCLDSGYMDMRMRRMSIFPGPPGAPSPVEQLKRYCAAQASK